jgi:hypothetical protein
LSPDLTSELRFGVHAVGIAYLGGLDWKTVVAGQPIFGDALSGQQVTPKLCHNLQNSGSLNEQALLKSYKV